MTRQKKHWTLLTLCLTKIMLDERPLVDYAFLDSGTGGIPYMLYLKKLNPSVKCVYLGDTKNFPYGTKSSEEIVENASGAVRKILSRWNPKAIVVACNTISVTALEELRKEFYPLPFVGTVPAIKLAAKISKSKNIGLLATDATVNHEYTKKLILDFAKDCRVYSRGDAELISFIEKKLFTASEEEKKAALMPAINYFSLKGCDTIVLACTHFIHMAEEIARYAGEKVGVIDSREGVAKQALRIEGLEPSFNKDKAVIEDKMTLYVTGKTLTADEEEYQTLCKREGLFWGGLV